VALEPVPKLTARKALKCDESAAELQQGIIVRCDPLPTDEQATETIDPTVCALHNPTTRLAKDTSDHRWLTAAADVRDDAPPPNLFLARAVVVALVEAQMNGTTWTAGTSNDDGVECACDHPHVRDIRRGRDRRDRHTRRVGQDMALDAGFRSIGRVRTGLVPPFGALTMELSKLAHSKSRPRFWSYA